MGQESPPREYRLKAGRMWLALVWVSAPCIGVLVALLGDDDVPTWLKLLVAAFFLGLVGRLRFALRRGGTFADARGIEVRGYFRRTRFSWAQIQDIRARPNPAADRNRLAPAYFADVHHHNGKRTRLPWLDSAHVDVSREVAALRTLWERNRGTS
ncbi:PH domain-containing protein [Streptomyces amakusaensis]|uniref:PH domain-containing protein n=1 Tax=Streptomyces amakusaensis TaxID=67271 RepID=A0ABW0AM50_9ACTN